MKMQTIGNLLGHMFELPVHCREIRIKVRYDGNVEIESDHITTVDGVKQIKPDRSGIQEHTVKTMVSNFALTQIYQNVKKFQDDSA